MSLKSLSSKLAPKLEVLPDHPDRQEPLPAEPPADSVNRDPVELIASVAPRSSNRHSEPPSLREDHQVSRRPSPTSTVDDLPPYSEEAEKALISCILLEPGEVSLRAIKRCRQRGIAQDWFYLRANRIIYQCIEDMWEGGKYIDASTLTVELRERKELNQVGGAPYVNEAWFAASSSTSLDYFAGILEEHLERRRALAGAFKLSAIARHGEGDANSIRQQVAGMSQSLRSTGSPMDRMTGREFDPANPPPKEPPVLWIGEAEACHPGNVTLLEAHIKSGKSSFVSAGIASVMGQQGKDYIGWRSDGNPGKKAILHFDTEQSAWHHHQMMMRALSRGNLSAKPEYLHSFRLMRLDHREMVQEIECSLERLSAKHGGLHSVWVDGVADLIPSPNDDIAAFALVRHLQALAMEFHCPIIVVLHLNPGDPSSGYAKSRGHIGSDLNRKAETIVRLTKDAEEITTVHTQETRGAKSPNNPRFSWSDEHGRHMSVSSALKDKRSNDEKELLRLIKAVWMDSPNGVLRHDKIVEEIQKANGKKEGTAKSRLGSMQTFGLVIKENGDRGYSVTLKGQSAFDPEESL